MIKQNLEKNSVPSNAKTHDEILELLEEIKGFEKKFQKHDVEEIKAEEEFIDVEPETFEEVEPIPVEKETKKSMFSDKRIKLIAKPKVKKEKIEKPITPVTFKVRFNEEGKLENVDFKKRKPNPRSEKRFSLKKLRTRKKTESEGTEEKSKSSRLRGGLSRLKRVIPTKSRKTEETKESAEE